MLAIPATHTSHKVYVLACRGGQSTMRLEGAIKSVVGPTLLLATAATGLRRGDDGPFPQKWVGRLWP